MDENNKNWQPEEIPEPNKPVKPSQNSQVTYPQQKVSSKQAFARTPKEKYDPNTGKYVNNKPFEATSGTDKKAAELFGFDGYDYPKFTEDYKTYTQKQYGNKYDNAIDNAAKGYKEEENPLSAIPSDRQRAFDMGSGGYYGVEYDPKTKKIYAGTITNSGATRDVEISYDFDASLDENLNNLYNNLYEYLLDNGWNDEED